MRFYDFPDAYDLFYTEQYHEDCEKFYKEIFGKKKYKDMLDCAVGTGQMLIPLAQLGYTVTGTDINNKMIRRAGVNFAKFKLFANLNVSDFRNLKDNVKQQYDCVLCTGNSIGHVKNEDLPSVIQSMDSLIRPGGMFYMDSKNWENILKTKKRFYLYNPIVRDRGRVNYVQVWDYIKNEDEVAIMFNYLITEELDNKIISKRQFYEVYFPFTIDMIKEQLTALNYKNINVCKLGDATVKDIDNIDWYALTAEKPIGTLN